MPNGKPKKNRRGRTKNTISPSISPPSHHRQIPPQPAQRYQCPNSNSQVDSSDNDPS